MEKHEIFETELNYIKEERIRNATKIILDLLPNYFYEIPASSTGKYHPDFSLGKGGLVRHVKVATRILKDLIDEPAYVNNYSPFASINSDDKDNSRNELGYSKNCFRSDLKEKKTNNDRDIMLMAIIIHDGLKDGINDFSYDKELENINKLDELRKQRDELKEFETERKSEIIALNKEIGSINKKIHFTEFNHPILISNFVKNNREKLDLNIDELNLLCSCLESHMGGLNYKEEDLVDLTEKEKEVFIKKYEFNKKYKQVWDDDKKSFVRTQDIEGELPLPVTKYQVLVHTADFLSSRKYLNVKFDENSNIDEREEE